MSLGTGTSNCLREVSISSEKKRNLKKNVVLWLSKFWQS